MIKFTIPKMTPLLNEWQRMHWRTRKQVNEEWMWWVRDQWCALPRYEGELPLLKCTVHIERHNYGVFPDWDGLYGGLKPLIDALVKNGIIKDDNQKVITQLTAKSVKCKKGEGKTVVIIEEAL